MLRRRGMRFRSGSHQRRIVSRDRALDSVLRRCSLGSPQSARGRPDGSVSRLRGVNANALAGAMVDRDKHGGRTFFDRECLSQVGAPHLIGLLSRNRAIVDSAFASSSWTRLKPIFAHQAADPIL